METRSKKRDEKEKVKYSECFESPSDLPGIQNFKVNLDYEILKKLKPSTLKQGPWRSGCVPLTKKQYLVLLDTISHRFQPHSNVIEEFGIATERFFNENNSVVMQTDTFLARVSKPRVLKYFNQNLEKKEIKSSAYEFKFKFKKRERVHA
jgi:hypothetical protein